MDPLYVPNSNESGPSKEQQQQQPPTSTETTVSPIEPSTSVSQPLPSTSAMVAPQDPAEVTREEQEKDAPLPDTSGLSLAAIDELISDTKRRILSHDADVEKIRGVNT